MYKIALDHQPLNIIFNSPNLGRQITGLIGSDTTSDNRTANTARSPQSHLAGDVDVRHILVLCEQREMEKDSQRGSIGCENDDFRGSTVKRLGGFVSTLLQLAVVGGLLDEVEEGLG